MPTGTRFVTTAGTDTSFGSDTLAMDQVEDLAQQAQLNAVDAIAAAASQTPTAAQLVGGILTTTGGTTCSVTFPSAATVVAAIVNVQVGSSFDIIVENGNTGTLTFVAGGATIVGPTTMVAGSNSIMKGLVTNATVGAEAYTIYTALSNYTTTLQAFPVYAIDADASGAATITLSAGQQINGIVTLTTGSTCALTFASAASVIAAIPNCVVGSSFRTHVYNNNSGTCTLTAGGATLVGTAAIATTLTQEIIGVVTNVGTPAYSMYAGSKVAT